MSVFRFAHLPWPGALCDQHPDVIDAMLTIRTAIAEEEKRQQRENENKSRNRKR